MVKNILINKKTVLITGGAGFIGSSLTDYLLIKGFRVISVDNFDPYYSDKFKKENISKNINNPDLQFFNIDIRNEDKLRQIFNKYCSFYSIIHLAARPGVRLSLKYPEIYRSLNVEGTETLLKVVTQYKNRQFIFASSSSVYGNAGIPYKENSILSPLSPYGKTKLEGERICSKYHKLFELPITILRFFSVYGPRGRPDMAPYIFTKSVMENKVINQYGDGSSARDWTYIDDIVKGIYKAIKKTYPFEIINLGGNKPITLNNLLNLIESAAHKKFKKNIINKLNEEAVITNACIGKAKKLLNWESKIEINEGMKIFIKWYKKNRLS